MANTNCNHDQPCGCNNDELTTLPDPCDTTNCEGEECDTIIDCNCVRYNGESIPQLGIQSGDSVCDILTAVIGLGGVPGNDGVDGNDGATGPQGPVGPQGPPGPSSPGQAGCSGFLVQDDTGWIDLEGFNYYTSSAATEKPKARRIGRTIHLKGKVYIPITAKGGGIQNLTSLDETSTNGTSCYRDIDTCDIFGYTTPTGPQITAGAVKITGQTIEFNGGNAVIPTSITSGSTDFNYNSTLFPVFRNIRTEVNSTNYSWIFTSFISIEITTDKKLKVKSLSDYCNETSNTTDALRVLVEDFGNTTKIKSWDYVNANSLINGSSLIGQGFTPDVIWKGDSAQGESYGFDHNGYNITELGGFSFSLDGITLTLPKVNLAVLSGSVISSITSSGASVSSSITSNNGTISYKGIAYGLAATPTINNSYILDTTLTNSINCTLTGLASGTTYYVRSFCINDAGVSYGAQSSFTTL